MATPFVPKGPAYASKEDKLRQEIRNGIQQAEFVICEARDWQSTSRLTPKILKEFQRLAVTQIYRCAGEFRDGKVLLDPGGHVPPLRANIAETFFVP